MDSTHDFCPFRQGFASGATAAGIDSKSRDIHYCVATAHESGFGEAIGLNMPANATIFQGDSNDICHEHVELVIIDPFH